MNKPTTVLAGSGDLDVPPEKGLARTLTIVSEIAGVVAGIAMLLGGHWALNEVASAPIWAAWTVNPQSLPENPFAVLDPVSALARIVAANWALGLSRAIAGRDSHAANGIGLAAAGAVIISLIELSKGYLFP